MSHSSIDASPWLSDGDDWVTGGDGRRYWGSFGAAGLLIHDPRCGVLLQHRAPWCDVGNTWGIPGGARRRGESALDGALREAEEEVGVHAEDLRIHFTHAADLGSWSYITIGATAVRPVPAHVNSTESVAIRWVPIGEVETMDLHPGFAAAWPALRAHLTALPPD